MYKIIFWYFIFQKPKKGVKKGQKWPKNPKKYSKLFEKHRFFAFFDMRLKKWRFLTSKWALFCPFLGHFFRFLKIIFIDNPGTLWKKGVKKIHFFAFFSLFYKKFDAKKSLPQNRVLFAFLGWKKGSKNSLKMLFFPFFWCFFTKIWWFYRNRTQNTLTFQTDSKIWSLKTPLLRALLGPKKGLILVFNVKITKSFNFFNERQKPSRMPLLVFRKIGKSVQKIVFLSLFLDLICKGNTFKMRFYVKNHIFRRNFVKNATFLSDGCFCLATSKSPWIAEIWKKALFYLMGAPVLIEEL